MIVNDNDDNGDDDNDYDNMTMMMGTMPMTI